MKVYFKFDDFITINYSNLFIKTSFKEKGVKAIKEEMKTIIGMKAGDLSNAFMIKFLQTLANEHYLKILPYDLIENLIEIQKTNYVLSLKQSFTSEEIKHLFEYLRQLFENHPKNT